MLVLEYLNILLQKLRLLNILPLSGLDFLKQPAHLLSVVFYESLMVLIPPDRQVLLEELFSHSFVSYGLLLRHVSLLPFMVDLIFEPVEEAMHPFLCDPLDIVLAAEL